jgi:hypothetical protein
VCSETVNILRDKMQRNKACRTGSARSFPAGPAGSCVALQVMVEERLKKLVGQKEVGNAMEASSPAIARYIDQSGAPPAQAPLPTRTHPDHLGRTGGAKSKRNLLLVLLSSCTSARARGDPVATMEVVLAAQL